jgi:hypothetical protein
VNHVPTDLDFQSHTRAQHNKALGFDVVLDRLPGSSPPVCICADSCDTPLISKAFGMRFMVL